MTKAGKDQRKRIGLLCCKLLKNSHPQLMAPLIFLTSKLFVNLRAAIINNITMHGDHGHLVHGGVLVEASDLAGEGVHHPHGVQVCERPLPASQPPGQQLDDPLQ